MCFITSHMIQRTQRWQISSKNTKVRWPNMLKKCSNFGRICGSQISPPCWKPKLSVNLKKKISDGHEAHQILHLAKTNNVMCFESGYYHILTVKIEKCWRHCLSDKTMEKNNIFFPGTLFLVGSKRQCWTILDLYEMIVGFLERKQIGFWTYFIFWKHRVNKNN